MTNHETDSDPTPGQVDWKFPSFQLELPDWIPAFLPPPEHQYSDEQEQMEVVIELARQNINRGGGPFSAAVFDSKKRTMIAPGVNLVVSSMWSGAHAEMVAFVFAQQAIRTHDLGTDANRPFELVTSCEPCSMCFGATPWSGVTKLICGAREEDARAVGFDEGPKPNDWANALEQRGIRVRESVMRSNARQVLMDYANLGGLIYNGRKSD